MQCVRSGANELCSHKTLVMVDCSAAYAAVANETFRCLPPQPTTNDSLASVSQLRWSCTVQAVLEFHRVLTDLYPYGSKLMRLATTGGRLITADWSEAIVSYKDVVEALRSNRPDARAVGTPSDGLKSGITMCVEALKTPTPAQRAALATSKQAYKRLPSAAQLAQPVFMSAGTSRKQTLHERLRRAREKHYKYHFAETSRPLPKNRGTIVAFSSVTTLADLEAILKNAERCIADQNYNLGQIASEMGGYVDLPIDRVRLYIVHIESASEQPIEQAFIDQAETVCDLWQGKVEPKIYFSSEKAPIQSIVHVLLYENYQVGVTRIQAIPMKDELTGNSITHNVEVLHRLRAHTYLSRAGFLNSSSMLAITEPDGVRQAVYLRWSNVNGRFNHDDPPLFDYSSPVTMANARNRAALCLSNYVLAKKVVMCDTKCIADITTLRVNFAEARISHFFTLDNNIDAITLKSMVFETDGIPLPPLSATLLRTEPLEAFLAATELKPNSISKPRAEQTRALFASQHLPYALLAEHTSDAQRHTLYQPSQAVSSESQQHMLGGSVTGALASNANTDSPNWIKNETINAESFFAKQAQQQWRGWRDFQGHRGGGVAQLYPNIISANDGGVVASDNAMQ